MYAVSVMFCLDEKQTLTVRRWRKRLGSSSLLVAMQQLSFKLLLTKVSESREGREKPERLGYTKYIFSLI